MHLRVKLTKKYSEIATWQLNWLRCDAKSANKSNFLFRISASYHSLYFCASSVHSKCASGAYTCSNLYILRLVSPALTSFDAFFLPGGSTVDAFPFIGLLPLLFFQRHTSRIYKHSYHWRLRTIFFFLVLNLASIKNVFPRILAMVTHIFSFYISWRHSFFIGGGYCCFLN